MAEAISTPPSASAADRRRRRGQPGTSPRGSRRHRIPNCAGAAGLAPAIVSRVQDLRVDSAVRRGARAIFVFLREIGPAQDVAAAGVVRVQVRARRPGRADHAVPGVAYANIRVGPVRRAVAVHAAHQNGMTAVADLNRDPQGTKLLQQIAEAIDGVRRRLLAHQARFHGAAKKHTAGPLHHLVPQRRPLRKQHPKRAIPKGY